MIVERVVAERARIAGQGGHDHGAARGETIEKWNPARQPAEPGDEPELRPASLAPHAAREAVDLDRRGLKFAQDADLPARKTNPTSSWGARATAVARGSRRMPAGSE